MFLLTLHDRSRIGSLWGGKEWKDGKWQNRRIIFIDVLPVPSTVKGSFPAHINTPSWLFLSSLYRGEVRKPSPKCISYLPKITKLCWKWDTTQTCSTLLLVSFGRQDPLKPPVYFHTYPSAGPCSWPLLPEPAWLSLFVICSMDLLGLLKWASKVLRTLTCRYHVAPVSALRELKIWSGMLVLITTSNFFSQFAFILLLFWNFLTPGWGWVRGLTCPGPDKSHLGWE